MSSSTKATKIKHPDGLKLLNISIALQSYAGYAVISFMVLFLTASASKNGLGLGIKEATGIMGLYSGLGYMTPLIGGWLSDRYLGLQKAILLGAFLAAVGYLTIFLLGSTLTGLWIGLAVMIISGGFFKGNVSALVGELYSKKELSKKDAAYSIFYMAVNLGSLMGPIVAGLMTDSWFAKINADGTIASYGYKQAFLMSSIVMFITFFLFLYLAPKWLKDIGKKPALQVEKEKKGTEKGPKLTKLEKNRMLAMAIVFGFVTLFFAAYFQTQTSVTLLADTLVNRNVFGFTIPVPWLISFNGILCVILAPLLGGLWVRLERSKYGDLSIPMKMGLGMILTGTSFVILIIGIAGLGGVEDGSAKMGLGFLLIAYIILTIGELFLSPIGMAMFNKLAPAKYASLAMGAWYLCFFFASIISGKVAGFTENMGYGAVFKYIAIIVIVFGVILLLIRNKLTKMMALDQIEMD
ncbi:peptide MFS transporter [Peptostreptococcus faecalis]|uniref:peptide MFS transporter n=1 Tax=Peptostreptococcus faecalis TaxID=2045015 RepID=UPI000C7B85BF|nr:peptide MFS transporter [Peptostreptococcus faecalis]